MSNLDIAEILTKTSRELKQMLEPNSILDHLLSEGVLWQSEFDRCREPHCQSREDQCEELINILKQKGHSGYQHFCTILGRKQPHLKSLLDITAKSSVGSGISDTCNQNAQEEALVVMKKELKRLKTQEKRHEKQIRELTSRLMSGGQGRKDKSRQSSQSSETVDADMRKETGEKPAVVKEQKGKSLGRDQLLKWGGTIFLAVVCSVYAVYMIHDTFMNRIGMNYGCRAELASIIDHAAKQEHIINHTHSLLDEAIRKQAVCDIERSAESQPMTEQTDLDTRKDNDMIYKDLKKCQGTINSQKKKINKYAESYRQQINTCSIWDLPCKTCDKSSVLQWIFWTPLYVLLLLSVLLFPVIFAFHDFIYKRVTREILDKIIISTVLMNAVLCCIFLEALWYVFFLVLSYILFHLWQFCYDKFG